MALLFFNCWEDIWLEKPLVHNFEWGSCYPPISYPYIILVLHLKSVWSAVPTQELTPKILVIWYCFSSYIKYHEHLGDHSLPTPHQLYLHICIFRVLEYAHCFACIFILPCTEQASYCVVIPWKQMYPQQCSRTWYV